MLLPHTLFLYTLSYSGAEKTFNTIFSVKSEPNSFNAMKHDCKMLRFKNHVFFGIKRKQLSRIAIIYYSEINFDQRKDSVAHGSC